VSRRIVTTFVCDTCGRLSSHEMLHSGFNEQIYTMYVYPRDWTTVKRDGGGGELSPPLDYCPTCKPQGDSKP
jgi:hypothetical protein